MTPIDRRIEHLRFEHHLRVDPVNQDLIGDILFAGEDAGCEDCKRLLDTWLTEARGEATVAHRR